MMSLLARIVRRLKKEVSDGFTYFLLPLPAVLLPWAVAYRIYYRLAAYPVAFTDSGRRALHGMERFGFDPGLAPREVLRRFRLVQMCDVIDLWVSIAYGRRCLKLVKQNDGWPAERPLVIVGTHWGPGLLGLRSMCAQGLMPHYVIRPVPAEWRKTQFMRWAYFRLRSWHLNRLLPGKKFDTGASPRRLIRVLGDRGAILMLTDTPASGGEAMPVCLFGRETMIHRGLSGTLARRRVPYITFSMSVDWRDGRRVIELGSVRQQGDVQAIRSELTTFVSRTLTRDPSQWQLWPFIDQYTVSNVP